MSKLNHLGNEPDVVMREFASKPEQLGVELSHILNSKEFMESSAKTKIKWIFYSFQSCIRVHPENFQVIRGLIHCHSKQLFQEGNLQLPDACLLTEAIHGMNWGDANSLFDMRGYQRYGVNGFYNYLSNFCTKFDERNYLPSTDKPLKIAYLSHYADLNRGNAVGPMN